MEVTHKAVSCFSAGLGLRSPGKGKLVKLKMFGLQYLGGGFLTELQWL